MKRGANSWRNLGNIYFFRKGEKSMNLEDVKFSHNKRHKYDGMCSSPALCPLGWAIAEVERLKALISKKEEEKNYGKVS